MRLPFPERLPLLPVLIFCLALNVLQQIDGTTVFFSAGTTIFILIATIAFNVAGGLTRASGGYIFSYAVLVAIIGITYKIVLGEPGQSNLLQPNLTIEVYVGTVTSMLVAAYLARRFTLKKSLFPRFSSNFSMGLASVACFFLGAVAQLYGTFATPFGSGSLLSAFNQLNYFLPLAIILGVTYEIRKSGGRRSVNTLILIACLLTFSAGIIGYSKTGLFFPFACWFFAAAAQRYKINIVQIASLVLAFTFISYYLVPYCQYGRSFRVEGQPLRESIKTNILLLSHLDQVRTVYYQDEERFSESHGVFFRYYDHPQGFADRLQMIAADDTIINATETGSAFGILPTIFAFENDIPHFIWPNKPNVNFGNVYAHEVGVITDDADTTTGISFSPSGDAYHQARWSGVLILLPTLLFILFLVTDSCCGDTRESPFALLASIFFLHAAPEGGMEEIIHSSTFVIAGLFLVALFTVKVLPVLGNLIANSMKRQMGGGTVIGPQTSRFVSAAIISGTDVAEQPLSPYRWSNPGSRK